MCADRLHERENGSGMLNGHDTLERLDEKRRQEGEQAPKTFVLGYGCKFTLHLLAGGWSVKAAA
jgi:hypothetical protein